jgi:hypothetical protein
METPILLATCALRPAWNKGRIVGQKRPLKPKHVWAIRVRLELAENHRDLALFNMAIDSKLRGSDVVKMKNTNSTQILTISTVHALHPRSNCFRLQIEHCTVSR